MMDEFTFCHIYLMMMNVSKGIYYYMALESLTAGDAYIHQWNGSLLFQAMACGLFGTY